MISLCIIILYIHTYDLNSASGYTLQQEDELQTALLTGYNKYIRPGTERLKPLNVTALFSLVSLKHFDERKGKFSVGGLLRLAWTDERISWIPSHGNGFIRRILIPQDLVWTPKMTLVNPFREITVIGTDGLLVDYLSTGQAHWIPGDMFESACEADVTYYPFDTQTCALKLRVLGYSPLDISVFSATESADLKHYTENGVWEIARTRAYVDLSYSNMGALVYEFTLKRRSGFHLVNMILPMSFLNFLNVVVFLLPAESGERVGYTITILLAIAVYMTVIADKLPEASEPALSALSYKLLADMCIGCLITLLTIIGLRFYNGDGTKPIPKSLEYLASIMSLNCKIWNQQSKVNDKGSFGDDNMDDGQHKRSETVTENKRVLTWVEVGKAFDRLCFIIANAVFFLSSLIYFCIILT